MQPAYRPPRDRDASPTIRGYVYQVDRTVERWLVLPEGHCLELERGEDIDLDRLGVALGTQDAGERARLLEQIKHRERNLTLRDPSALEALANAVEHLHANQGVELRFCYLTNAAIGRERLYRFPAASPASRSGNRCGPGRWPRARCPRLSPASASSSGPIPTEEGARRSMESIPDLPQGRGRGGLLRPRLPIRVEYLANALRGLSS